MNDQEWQALRNKARGIAIEEYSAEASSIIRLTRDEITSIIEDAGVDKEKFSELISVVNDATKSNEQKANALKNIDGFAEIAASLIGRLII